MEDILLTKLAQPETELVGSPTSATPNGSKLLNAQYLTAMENIVLHLLSSLRTSADNALSHQIQDAPLML